MSVQCQTLHWTDNDATVALLYETRCGVIHMSIRIFEYFGYRILFFRRNPALYNTRMCQYLEWRSAQTVLQGLVWEKVTPLFLGRGSVSADFLTLKVLWAHFGE